MQLRMATTTNLPSHLCVLCGFGRLVYRDHRRRCPRQLLGKRDGQRPASRANIHPHVAVILLMPLALVLKHRIQREIDQLLGLRPGNEHALPYQEDVVTPVSASGDILERDALAQPIVPGRVQGGQVGAEADLCAATTGT